MRVRRLFPPPVLFLLLLIAASVAERFRPAPIADYSFRTGMTIASAIGLLALANAAWAIIEMRRHHTTVEPWHTPSRLVTSGPFAWTRNPLYISLTLIEVAIAIAVDSLWILAAAVVLFVLLDRVVVRGEEEIITKEFGEEYTRYRARVRRWL